jgi:hypothetical protein
VTPNKAVAGLCKTHCRCCMSNAISRVFSLAQCGRVSRTRSLTRAAPPATYGYRRAYLADGVQPNLHVEYNSSHVKQYFKEHRAFRRETSLDNSSHSTLPKLWWTAFNKTKRQ